MKISELIKVLTDVKVKDGDLLVVSPDRNDELAEIDSCGVCRSQDNTPFAVELWNEYDNQHREEVNREMAR